MFNIIYFNFNLFPIRAWLSVKTVVNVSIGLHLRDLNVRVLPSFTVRTVLTGIMTVMRKNAENMDFVLIKSETRYVK